MNLNKVCYILISYTIGLLEELVNNIGSLKDVLNMYVYNKSHVTLGAAYLL